MLKQQSQKEKNSVQQKSVRVHLWTEEEIDLIKKLYGNINCKEIQKRYFPHLSNRQIQTLINRLKLPSHGRRLISTTCTYDKEYFKILNVNNCYIGGLWAADACVYQPSKNSYVLQHTSIDKDLLETIKAEVKFSGIISQSSKKMNDQDYPIWKIAIGGIQHDWLLDIQNSFHIIPRKTYSLSPPNLTDSNHILAYIKGFIDGDGCICLKKKRLRISIVCHQKIVLDWILSIYQRYIDTEATVQSRSRKNSTLYILEISGNYAYKMGKILEKSSPLGLSRKWSKLDEWFDINKEVK